MYTININYLIVLEFHWENLYDFVKFTQLNSYFNLFCFYTNYASVVKKYQASRQKYFTFAYETKKDATYFQNANR